jgi:hypothetical protein
MTRILDEYRAQGRRFVSLPHHIVGKYLLQAHGTTA